LHGDIADDHDSPAHHHNGDGMLAPWLVSPNFVFVSAPLPSADCDFVITKLCDAPVWRRDRPPKLDLERIA
jgi:hypothetical protein